MSPPYRKIRALRLMDTPETPKTIIQNLKTLTDSHSASSTTTPEDEEEFFCHRKPLLGAALPPIPRPVPVHHYHHQSMVTTTTTSAACPSSSSTTTANVNPFTPDGMLMNSKKRARIDKGTLSTAHKLSIDNRQRRSIFDQSVSSSSSAATADPHPSSSSCSSTAAAADEEDMLELCQAPKRLALQDTNISRYEKEFVQLSVIGAGEFGEVFRCLNRLDGCIYAVKKSKKPVAGSAVERIALNEVWAHAVLGKHDNVVRYYSAWAENNHMLIQNEFCDGGSLQALLQTRSLTEPELRLLVAHIAEGLKYIHSNDLVHLDLKAGNIFLTKMQQRTAAAEAACRDDGFVDDYYDRTDTVTYKIGDLGHVTSVLDPDVEEGDCRYLPAEILHEDFAHLQKADIFALGITLYEAAGGGPLPKNGAEWHKLRTGQVPRLAHLSAEFNDLIAQMTHPDATQRPSATTITRHPCLEEAKSKSQLSMELTLLRHKNEQLQKALSEAKKKIKSMEMQARTPGAQKRDTVERVRTGH